MGLLSPWASLALQPWHTFQAQSARELRHGLKVLLKVEEMLAFVLMRFSAMSHGNSRTSLWLRREGSWQMHSLDTQ